MFGRGKRRKNRKRDGAVDTVSNVAEGGFEGGTEAVDGCLGCDISLVVALILLAAAPLLLWSI